jgi:hypothetical protein
VKPNARPWLLCSLLVFAWHGRAAADAPPATYALLVGSNPGGEGQSELHYAEDDAKRLAEVFTELGHVPAAHTRVLLGPDRDDVLEALDALREPLAAHRARGEEAQLLFYYSGHARASAIQLGSHELQLSELRQRILSLPTTLTLIVLDACQSGAFTSVKGARPAAAFSYNSVSRLRTSGVAVMASSSASELSQESEALRASYFTHHLLVGLRGAGDGDRNGVVSLAEAYRYAYERTLSSTARTAVGGQHVTLQTALTGQGEVPLTYPARAEAQLELGAALEADVLLERDASVMAELHKVPGHPVRLALPAGDYTAVLRAGGSLSQCALALSDARVTLLAAGACRRLSQAEAASKGYWQQLGAAGSWPPPRRELWSVDVTIGLGSSSEDAYTQRLKDFAFQSDASLFPGLRLQVSVARQLGEHLSAVLDLRNLDDGAYQRTIRATDGHTTEHFRWWSLALGAHLRAHVDPARSLRLYAQLGIGPGMAVSTLDDYREYRFGPMLSAAAGLFWMPFGIFGFVAQASYSYAPLLRNELDDAHNGGGFNVSTGFRIRNWGAP